MAMSVINVFEYTQIDKDQVFRRFDRLRLKINDVNNLR